MRIDVITLFPEIFFGPFDESIIGRARKQGLVEINTIDLRKYTHDSRGTVDDKPYGGGPGMLMKAEPLFEAIEDLRTEESLVILTGPRGEQFKQATARELSLKPHLIFISGHYEGVDERVREALIDREMSIGDYVLTSGNLAAMVMIDAAVRLLPGVLGSPESENRRVVFKRFAGVSAIYATAGVQRHESAGNPALRRSWSHRKVAA